MPLCPLPLRLSAFALSALCLPLCPALQAAPAAPDYARAPAMRLRHWPRFPVRVFLATHGAEEAREAEDAQAGFDAWVRATGGAVRYVVVDAPDKADLTVRFVPSAALPGKAGAVGMTTVYSHGRRWRGPRCGWRRGRRRRGTSSPRRHTSSATRWASRDTATTRTT